MRALGQSGTCIAFLTEPFRMHLPQQVVREDPPMASARAHIVNPAFSRWCHFATRWVRRTFLLGDEHQGRNAWFERRLQELAEMFRATQ